MAAALCAPAVAAALPRVTMARPPIATRTYRTVLLRGSLDGTAEPASGEASFTVSRLSRGVWVPWRSLPATITSLSETRSLLTADFRPTMRGRWLIRLRVAPSRAATGAVQSTAHGIVSVRSNRYVALTFDGGPWRSWTDGVLRVLKRNDARATFFFIGKHVRLYPRVGRRVVRAGHQIGNHTMSHPRLTSCSNARVKRELRGTNREIRRRYGVSPTVFRPPDGITDSRVRRVARSLGLTQVMWTADSADWLYPAPSAITRRVMRRVKPGGIVLMHDGGGNRSTTVKALPTIIRRLRARGWEFVTVSERAQLRRMR